MLPEPYQRTLLLVVSALLLCLPVILGPYGIHLMNLAMLAVIGAVGLNILTGYCGQISLGHASFIAIGAFLTATLSQRYGMPFWVTLPASCLLGALIGFVVGLPALRFRGIYLAITTLTLHYAIIYLLTAYQTAYGAAATAGIVVEPPRIAGFSLDSDLAWFYVLFAFAAATVFIGLNIARSYMGRAFIAIRERDVAAATLGINVTRYKLLAFMISAALAALTGSLTAYFTSVVTVEEYTLELAILYLAMIIVGGMGSIIGAVFGAIFMTLLPFMIDEIFQYLPRQYRYGTTLFGVQHAVIGVVIIGFLLVEPRGLIEVYRRLASYFERWPFRYREMKGG